MPKPDQAILPRRLDIIKALRRIVFGEGVIDPNCERHGCECDALIAYWQLPLVVVLPQTTAQVAKIPRYCKDNNIKVVPRGAGTSLRSASLHARQNRRRSTATEIEPRLEKRAVWTCRRIGT
ncbi:FAD-binding oxidoreductase [Bradyrhizobium sp. CCBAU 21362]|uniref:FAD-binding oxidoreductase n=1 Tax=Bradyrhizobium sp. CCBAU 21362 TaxID=1325082 RepID=UPI0023063548|nr:FAD-binding protein [Bradyrhizobium sp. CCBAU 21362]